MSRAAIGKLCAWDCRRGKGKMVFAPFALYRASRYEDPEMTILRTPTR